MTDFQETHILVDISCTPKESKQNEKYIKYNLISAP